MLSKTFVILWKDLLSELRNKEMIFSMLIFSLMMSVVFNFSFPPGSDFIHEAMPGILWMTFIFASLLGLGRSFVAEVDKGCLMGLLLAPIDRATIFLSKLLVNFIFIMLVELISLPLFGIFFKVDLIEQFWSLIFVFTVSTLGFSIVGTLFSAISVNVRTREVMLPILHFPVSIPLIICGVQATNAALEGQGWNVSWGWAKIIIAFDIIFFIVGYLTFDFIVEE